MGVSRRSSRARSMGSAMARRRHRLEIRAVRLLAAPRLGELDAEAGVGIRHLHRLQDGDDVDPPFLRLAAIDVLRGP